MSIRSARWCVSSCSTDGEIVEVELSRERHESLQLAVGQAVWFRPRQMRVFGADNQPAATPEKQAFLFLIRGKDSGCSGRRML